jgi:hypothetical protein
MRLALLTFLVALPAVAAAQPRLVPSHDVAVVYRVGGAAAERIPGGAPHGVRVVWDAAGQRVRAEPIGQGTYAIADLGRHVTDIVFAAQVSYLELPIRVGDPQTLLAGENVTFTRRGTERLLGLECTDWAIHAAKVEGAGCVTPDGIVLRAEGMFDGQSGSMTAVSVDPAPQPDSAFRPPKGFFRLALGKH